MEKRFEAGTVYITLGEKLDYDLSLAAEDEIIPFLDGIESDGGEITAIVLDADRLAYISSAGIRLLLKLKKRIKNMRVLNVADNIYDTISITGMEEIFGLELKSAANGSSEHADNAAGSMAPGAQAGMHAAAQAGEADGDSARPPYDRSSWQRNDSGIDHEGINATCAKADFYAVTEQFEAQVQKHAKEIAVVSSKGSYTYEELNRAANRIANTLIFEGAKAEDVVCIMLERGIEIYAATLGVLKAGAAYTIVNPKYPDERIEYIYRDAGCKFIISSQQMVYDRLELFVDQLQKRPLFFEQLLSWGNTEDPKTVIYPEDLCYLIYTSGSTGKPKGVMIEHGNLSNFLLNRPENHEFIGYSTNGNSCLAMAQMTFDFSIMEQYIPLVSGKKVVLALYEEIANPVRMIDFMNEHKVDAACFTPSYLSSLMRLPKSREAVERLKVIDFGAEAFPGTLYDRIRAWNPDVLIMNGYGPTEATISCTMKVIESADNITIGRPNANVSVFAVDENNHEVPHGEQGELLIRGQGVGRGYVNLPEKTDEVFINFRGMRAYKSGDLVRINQNNEIEYLGRKDYQVKIRGLRIELGEVENVIAQMPGINLTAAASIDDQYLCIYYTSSNNVPEEEVRAYAKEHLAHYMVPDLYVLLERMPMTANQKIDRKALPKPFVAPQSITPAETEEQQQLLDLLASVMDENVYGIDTNLTEIGMSSLDVMLLISLIGEKYEIGISIGDLNAHPTIRELETFVKNAPKLKKRVKRDKYPATMLQTTDYYATIDGSGNM
ncbi:MAG: amino acid adenylation domain-containing protein, partial [Lachnospiraceae bacterium]|nr:amino acid adenylation domain-containing protein [Lachnospiraceae bacterium]